MNESQWIKMDQDESQRIYDSIDYVELMSIISDGIGLCEARRGFRRIIIERDVDGHAHSHTIVRSTCVAALVAEVQHVASLEVDVVPSPFVVDVDQPLRQAMENAVHLERRHGLRGGVSILMWPLLPGALRREDGVEGRLILLHYLQP